MRFISFPTGLGCSQWSPCFLTSLLYWVERFFTWFPFFSSTFPHSAELTSEKRGICNNVTLGAKAESSWSRSHVTTIIQNFTLVNLTSTAMPHPAGLLFKTMVLSHLTHLTTYLTPHCLHSRNLFPALVTICVLPTCQEIRLSFLERH